MPAAMKSVQTEALHFSGDVGADESDPQHVGRARRAKRQTGDDDDPLTGVGKAVAEGNAAGTLDHVILIVRILGDDAMHAPD